MLEGSITAVKSTPDGASVAITHMSPGGLFGDVLSGSSQKSPVTVMATTSCLALYLPYQKIIRPCAKLHSAHLQHQPVAAGRSPPRRERYLYHPADPRRAGRIPEL